MPGIAYVICCREFAAESKGVTFESGHASASTRKGGDIFFFFKSLLACGVSHGEKEVTCSE